MKLKGFTSAFGHKKHEKKDVTEYIHMIEVRNKDDFRIAVRSLGKDRIDEIKKNGTVTINGLDAEVTVKVELKVKREKFDKETENVLPKTGDPWYTFVKTIPYNGVPKDMLNDVNKALTEEINIDFV